MIVLQIKELSVKTLQSLITILISFYAWDRKDRSKVAVHNFLLVFHQPFVLQNAVSKTLLSKFYKM